MSLKILKTRWCWTLEHFISCNQALRHPQCERTHGNGVFHSLSTCMSEVIPCPLSARLGFCMLHLLLENKSDCSRSQCFTVSQKRFWLLGLAFFLKRSNGSLEESTAQSAKQRQTRQKWQRHKRMRHSDVFIFHPKSTSMSFDPHTTHCTKQACRPYPRFPGGCYVSMTDHCRGRLDVNPEMW